ncbi:MAG TPA: ribonuclease domain-containing protein [Planctomycetaceae bacterium]|nr:ribonuclease domain-containing protein [Planctomycetaceae bacterium]
MPRDITPEKSSWTPPTWIFRIVIILLIAWWVSQQAPPEPQRGAAPAPEENARFEPSIPVPVEPATETDADNDSPAATTRESKPTPRIEARTNDSLIIPKVTIKDQSGRVVYQGEIDLGPTLERIERGEKLSHRNDGSTFRNLERRLPKKPAGYYTEYVHPTPGLNGPGPQRIVIGEQGETYYTADHYGTFRKVPE